MSIDRTSRPACWLIETQDSNETELHSGHHPLQLVTEVSGWVLVAQCSQEALGPGVIQCYSVGDEKTASFTPSLNPGTITERSKVYLGGEEEARRYHSFCI